MSHERDSESSLLIQMSTDDEESSLPSTRSNSSTIFQTESNNQGDRNHDTTRKQRRRQKKKIKQQHSLDHLKQRVSAIMALLEEHNLFVPLPESADQGKVWSNRNYGQDKKRQRKASERAFLQGRIAQLEAYLTEHNMDIPKEEK